MEHPIRSPDEGVMPPGKCFVVGSSDPSLKFRQSEVLTVVGTFGKPEKTWSGAQGCPHVRSSDKCRKFRLSELLTDPIKSSVRIMSDSVPIYPIIKQITLLPLLQPFYPFLQPHVVHLLIRRPRMAP
jgi:hypothetical protein